MKTMSVIENKSALSYIVEVWHKGDKEKLRDKLQIGLDQAKKENNLKLVRLLTSDLIILKEV